MRRPVEHGSVITSSILGITAIVNAVMLHKNYASVIYWVPVWFGLFLYDVPLSRIGKNFYDLILVSIITLLALISIILNPLLIVPYIVFFTVYGSRISLARKRMNFVSIIAGIGSYVLLFFGTWGGFDLKFAILVIGLFLFMIGSEFAVRAVVARNKVFLLYNIIPALFFLLNPIYTVFVISLIRIPFGLTTKKIKIIGMAESVILVVVMVVIEGLIILK